MLGSDVMDKLHDQHGLAYAGTAKQADFTAAGIRCDKVNDLDARFEYLGAGFLIFKFRSRTMDRPILCGIDRSRVLIHGLAQYVEDTAQSTFTNGNADGRAGIFGFHPAGETIGRAHSDAAGHAVAEVLHDFNHEVDVHFTGFALDGDCIQYFRQFASREFNIYDRSDNLYDFTFCQW